MRRLGVVLALLVLGAAAWEGLARWSGVAPILLPPPSLVVQSMWAAPGWLLLHALHTVMEAALGFVLAVVLGIAIAVVIVHVRPLEEALYTVLVGLNSLPKVALAPLFIVWLGTGLEPKVVMALVIAIFPIVIDTVFGLRSVEPEMLDLARSMGGSPLRTLMKIRFPTALPSIFAGMKVGISLALVGAIVGEFVAANRGLGYVVMTSQGVFDTARMFAAIVLLAVLGTILFYAVDLGERTLLPWHVSRRREAAGPMPPTISGGS